jgi:selenocysteine lyase/cysteine desulfurase
VVGVDVQSIQPDFLICATYKWLLGPYSLGFVYVNPRHHAGIPLEQGWVNRPGAEDFSRLIDYVDEINLDATRFDMGERSNFHLMPIAIAGLQQIHRWGQSEIETSLRSYTMMLRHELEAIGFSTCDEAFRSPHYLGVQHSDGLSEDILEQLVEEKIFLSKRGDSLRISPHLYNNEADALSLISALKRCLNG